MDYQTFAQLLGNYGEFFGAVAVFVTLVFLAIQIRQNTRQIRVSSAHQVMAMEANGRFALLNSEVPSILIRLRDGGDLTLEDQVRFDTFMHGVFIHYEATYLAYQAGTIPEEVMSAIDQRAKAFIDLPGWERRWGWVRSSYAESFARHIDELAK